MTLEPHQRRPGFVNEACFCWWSHKMMRERGLPCGSWGHTRRSNGASCWQPYVVTLCEAHSKTSFPELMHSELFRSVYFIPTWRIWSSKGANSLSHVGWATDTFPNEKPQDGEAQPVHHSYIVCSCHRCETVESVRSQQCCRPGRHTISFLCPFDKYLLFYTHG